MGVGVRLGAALAALSAAAVLAAPCAGAVAADGSGRVYEQVSAQDKNGNDGFVVTFPGVINAASAYPTLVADDGGAVLYGGNGAFADAAIGNQNAYLATRGASAWATDAIGPPVEARSPRVSTTQLALDASSDLRRVLFGISYLASGGVTSPDTVVLSERQPDGTVARVSRGSLGGTGAGDVFFEGMSRDGLRVVFASNTQLEPDAIDFSGTSTYDLYERDLTSGTTRLVSVLPDGTASPTGGQLGLPFSSGGNAGPLERASRMSVSDDGSRIFFTAADGTNHQVLYARVDGVRTLALSSVPGGAGPVGAQFEGATPDGDHAFFTDDAQLTGDAPASGTSLYRYDLAADGRGGTLTFLAGGMDAPGTTGWVGSSADGAVAYFVSHDALAGGAAPGDANLYADDHGAMTFVAALSGSDAVTEAQDQFNQRQAPQARVTPDGGHLLFQSFAQLDPAFDNAGHGEVWDYALGAAAPVCVSCGASPASADAQITTTDVAAALHPARAITGDGRWIFFETGESLVLGDQNQRVDVYQWHDGARALVSSGGGANDQHLFAVTPDARDVLISSYDRLAASDVDSSGDVYDARLGGGFPPPAPGGPAPCGGEDCRGASTPPSVGVEPGTDGTAGAWATGGRVPRGRAPRVRVVAHRSAAGALTLTLSVSGRGRIRAAGVGLAGATRTVAHAGTYRLRIRLTGARRVALARHGRRSMRADVLVSFRASGGRLARTTVVATVKA